MASSAVTARRYFAALAAHDLDAAVECWAPGAVSRLGSEDAVAPYGIHDYFGALFDAFPDFAFVILDTTTQRERCAVRWRAHATFVGPGRFQGFVPNGARIEISGCDVIEVRDDLIVGNDAFLDGAEIARQLGVLPPAGSVAEARLRRAVNARTRLHSVVLGAQPEAIAPGVWILRGARPRLMNVYLIEDGDGVTVFDGGVDSMADSIRTAAVRLGGIRRVILGHADADHRGGIASLGAPVYCHPLERLAAQEPSPYRDYWDLRHLSPLARAVYPRLFRRWDGGSVEIAGAVEEGEMIAGFTVVHLPGHAPGLVGLFRESDGLAIASDCFYTLDVETGRRAEARVPHRAFNLDTDQARESIRKLAALRPSIVWAGHGRPVTGDDVELQLQRAAVASA